jgi:hypothetical protein
MDLSEKVQQVESILIRNGFTKEAAQIRGLLDALLGHSKRRSEWLVEIRNLCGVKSFGDLYIEGIGDSEWLQLLSEVRQLT